MKTTTFFTIPRDLEDLRRQYKTLIKEHHPDNGGSAEDAQTINAEYKILFEALKKNATPGSKEAEHFTTEADEAFRATLNRVAACEGLTIAIAGTWIWISGDTYTHRDTLKDAGFRWCSKKRMWSWHTGEWKRQGKPMSMAHIASKYGCTYINGKRPTLLED